MAETNRDVTLLPSGNTKAEGSAQKQDYQYKYWCLTWNDYDLETLEIICNILKHEVHWYILQEETGASGNKHIQGTLHMLKKTRLTELKRIHGKIHWEVTKQISASCCYCSNKDKRTGDLFTYNFSVPNSVHNDFEPYGWQLDVIDILKKKPHPRLINWFWEPDGGVGKSELAIWLYDRMNALVCMGKAQDIFHILSKYPDRRKIIVFDITKEKMEFFNYSTIEQIKNGYVCSGKYDSCILRFERPHIVVFSNMEPDTHKLTTKDRWNIVKITLKQQYPEAP